MYIQSPFSVPKDYSGNAFSKEKPPDPPTASPIESPPEATSQPLAEPLTEESLDSPVEQEDATPAMSIPRKEEGGILSRIPFLSSLLPPPRGKRRKDGGLGEWAILGIFLFLFLENEENDLLPFLLMLLLWD